MAQNDTSALAFGDAQASDLSVSKRTSKYENSPFKAQLNISRERGVARTLDVPKADAAKVKGYVQEIRAVAKLLDCGVKVRLTENKSGTRIVFQAGTKRGYTRSGDTAAAAE